jgi:hypothetical protein
VEEVGRLYFRLAQDVTSPPTDADLRTRLLSAGLHPAA